MAAQKGRHDARDGADRSIMNEQTDRPANRRGDMLAVALMAMMTLVVFWQALVKPDQMLREDAAHFYQPYYTYANAEVQAGRFPLWNPYTKMGVPFHASLQPSLLYPLRWPMFFMNYVSGFVSTMMFHYFLTAVAAYLLLRIAIGVGPLAGLIGALSVAFGGFSMGHMTHTTYFLSYPWFLGCILCLWLAVERKRWLWTVAAGGCVGLMGLVGSVHLFLLLGVLLGTYVLYQTIVAAVAAFRQWKQRKVFPWKPVVNPAGMALAALVLGGAISAAQMLPAYSLSKRSSRQEAQWEFITRASAHPVRNSLQLVVPFYYGNCRLGYYGEYMYHGAAHYTGIVVLMGAVGTVKPEAQAAKDLEAFATPLTMKTLGDMSYAEIGKQLSALAEAYDVKLPRELVLIGKQFLYVERYMKLLAPRWQMMNDPQFSGYFANFMVEVSREHQNDVGV